jgi:hypothetical protein
MKRFRNMRYRIRRKICQLVNMVMERVPVTEIIIILSALIVQLLIFRPVIEKYIRHLLSW